MEIMKFQEYYPIVSAFVESGLFPDIKTEAQAIVKVQAGLEIGLQPFQALQSIDVIKGKISIKPILLAAIVKNSKKYNYRVLVETATENRIEFFELTNGKFESIGISTFTLDDAKRAGLAFKENWRQYPQSMLLWRNMAKGIRMFCPDVAMMPIYYEGELLDDTIYTTEMPPVPAPAPVKNNSVSSKPIKETTVETPIIETTLPDEEVPVADVVEVVSDAALSKLFKEFSSLAVDVDFDEYLKKHNINDAKSIPIDMLDVIREEILENTPNRLLTKDEIQNIVISSKSKGLKNAEILSCFDGTNQTTGEVFKYKGANEIQLQDYDTILENIHNF